MISNDNTIFQLAADFINKSNHPVFLTGKAGTGKTTFLKYIKEYTLKNTAIVAPTGVAAMNAGGTTIHSFFQLPFTPFLPGKNRSGETVANDKPDLLRQLRLNAERKVVLHQLDLLIIDEISMVRADVIDAIDAVLRYVRDIPGLPFGGVQVLYIGDMYQLPPVIKQEEWSILNEFYQSPFFFSSRIVTAHPPVYIELNKIYRQRDENFIRLLNQVRNNEMDTSGYELLQSRYKKDHIADLAERVITLTTHNASADAINGEALSGIKEKAWAFEAIIEGSFFENSFPADEILKLKVGAQVMFVKNDSENPRRYYNGKIGFVNKIEEDKIFVECITEKSKQLIEIKKEKWRNIKYTHDKKSGKIEEKEVGSFMQFPLRLAWAITIHKSQGLTFEKVVIDAGKAFAPGQVYVALSRCTSLEGLYLVSDISYKSLQSDPRIVTFSKQQKSFDQQISLLDAEKEKYETDSILFVFSFDQLDKQIENFQNFINIPGHFKGLTTWLQQLLNQWNKIKTPSVKFKKELLNLFIHKADTDNLEKRIIAASDYFSKEINETLSILKQSPAVTDNNQVAHDYDKKAQQLLTDLTLKFTVIENCRAGFSIENYQKNKSLLNKKLSIQSSYSGRATHISETIQPVLYSLLKKLRDELCSERNLPVYMVCSSQSLEEMTIALPVNLHQLEKITGFGKVKLKQFGSLFTDIISSYCEEHNLVGNPEFLPVHKIKKIKISSKPDTKNISLGLFKSGKNVKEIATERNLAISTIEGHLSHYIVQGDLKITALLDDNKISLLSKARQEYPDSSITFLKEKLPDVSYGELRLFFAYEKNALQNLQVSDRNHPEL
ncbi:MAG: helix-turn-helix domain-containing protein [Ferruginibacter sp.]